MRLRPIAKRHAWLRAPRAPMAHPTESQQDMQRAHQNTKHSRSDLRRWQARELEVEAAFLQQGQEIAHLWMMDQLA